MLTFPYSPEVRFWKIAAKPCPSPLPLLIPFKEDLRNYRYINSIVALNQRCHTRSSTEMADSANPGIFSVKGFNAQWGISEEHIFLKRIVKE
jgi:hypothetical protein